MKSLQGSIKFNLKFLERPEFGQSKPVRAIASDCCDSEQCQAQQCHAVRLFEPDLIPETMTKDDQRIDWVSNLGEGRSDDLYGTSRRRILLQLC